jgi:hypothetical protein
MTVEVVRATVNNRPEWRVYVEYQLDRVFLSEQEAIEYKVKLLEIFNKGGQ